MEQSARTGRESLRALAEALVVPEDDVLHALGGGWEPIELEPGEWPGTRFAGARWFVTGEPIQVLAGVSGSSLVLARPVLRWDGPGTVTTHATDERECAWDDVLSQSQLLADAVEEMARRSRRSFRSTVASYRSLLTKASVLGVELDGQLLDVRSAASAHEGEYAVHGTLWGDVALGLLLARPVHRLRLLLQWLVFPGDSLSGRHVQGWLEANVWVAGVPVPACSAARLLEEVQPPGPPLFRPGPVPTAAQERLAEALDERRVAREARAERRRQLLAAPVS